LGFDPYIDDATARPKPAKDLQAIYQLAGKTYNKKKTNVERTIECLDYAKIYLELNSKIVKLGEFIFKIDCFLS
jgi:aromatic ring hydroxylase